MPNVPPILQFEERQKENEKLDDLVAELRVTLEHKRSTIAAARFVRGIKKVCFKLL